MKVEVGQQFITLYSFIPRLVTVINIHSGWGNWYDLEVIVERYDTKHIEYMSLTNDGKVRRKDCWQYIENPNPCLDCKMFCRQSCGKH